MNTFRPSYKLYILDELVLLSTAFLFYMFIRLFAHLSYEEIFIISIWIYVLVAFKYDDNRAYLRLLKLCAL